MVTALYAVGQCGEFGVANRLPWTCKDDMARFKAITLAHGTVIVGRSTFNSMRHLEGRKTIVVCRNPEIYQDKETRPNVTWMTLEQALMTPKPLVIGGKAILEAVWPKVTTAYVSFINPERMHSLMVDQYFTPDLNNFREVYAEAWPDHQFKILVK